MSEHALLDAEQIELSAVLIVPADGAEVLLAPGPNCFDASMRELVHDDKLLSPFSKLRNDVHPSLIPVGMRGLALGADAAADEA